MSMRIPPTRLISLTRDCKFEGAIAKFQREALSTKRHDVKVSLSGHNNKQTTTLSVVVIISPHHPHPLSLE